MIIYPGLLAITINRLAHELYLLEIPLIPRMMTEYAHTTQFETDIRTLFVLLNKIERVMYV